MGSNLIFTNPGILRESINNFNSFSFFLFFSWFNKLKSFMSLFFLSNKKHAYSFWNEVKFKELCFANDEIKELKQTSWSLMFSNSYRSVNNSEWLLSNFCCKSTRSITSSNLGKKNIFFWIIDLLSYLISDSTSKFSLSL